MELLGWLRAWRYARRRRLDLEILWPCLVDEAQSLDDARVRFAIHAYNTPAWLALTPDELTRTLHNLREPMPRGPLEVISGEKLLAREKPYGP
jgi:hypothetical protein